MNVFADAEHWTGAEFRLGREEHLLALTLIVIFEVLLLNRMRDADPATRRNVRWALVAALWAQEVSYHIWRLSTRTWTPRQMLPLHLCSVMVWVGGLAMLTRSYRLYEYVYFAALAGAGLALATPDIGRFGFPHYRFFQFFVSHGLIINAPLWLTFVEGFRPSAASLGRALLGTGAWASGVFWVNRRLGSNYMFVNRKPETASALDALPPWPRYLPIMAGAVAGLFALLYAPWAIRGASKA
jgi:hypothetical integral membrane protein (TIGR02206 family)